MRNNLEGPAGFLSLDNFKLILNSYNFRYVALHGWGEPLLNPELFKMIRYEKKYLMEPRDYTRLTQKDY